MADQKIAELTQSIGASKRSKSVEFYQIPITIVNKSSVGFQKAEVAVKDEGSGQVATAYFGYIAAGSQATENVQLPGGVEVCIWKITPDFGDDIAGMGMGNNSRGVRLTITD